MSDARVWKVLLGVEREVVIEGVAVEDDGGQDEARSWWLPGFGWLGERGLAVRTACDAAPGTTVGRAGAGGGGWTWARRGCSWRPRLQRMVEHLNAVTLPEVQVLAFEVARVADQDVEILLPRVFGAELAQAKTTASGSQRSWSEAAYLTWM